MKQSFEDYQKLINSFDALTKSANNPFFHSKYVPLNQILPIVKEHCTKHNFAFSQYPEREEGKNILVTKVIHNSGEEITGKIELVSKDGLDPQKLGAAITYMRRYMLVTMFGLFDQDDDGNTAASNYIEPKGAKNINNQSAVPF